MAWSLKNSQLPIATDLLKKAKQDFPALRKGDIAYFDTASSAQKPDCVIQTMNDVMQTHYANVHRGLYKFSQQTTTLFEAVRGKVANFLNVSDERQIVFTRNATEAINLVAYCWGKENIQKGDEIILTALEHHANIVPWVRLAEEKGAVLRIVPLKQDGMIDLDIYQSYLQSGKVRLVSMIHISNVLGTLLPVRDMVAMARKAGAVTLIDGSQAAPQMPVSVRDIDCDFYVCTGHKLYGPNGVGILYGRYALFDAMPPFIGGGDMIESVSFEAVSYKAPPHRFEAGTPAIVEVIGLGAAIDYLQRLGMDNIAAHEKKLHDQAVEILSAHQGIRIFNPSNDIDKGAVLAFDWQAVHHHDLAAIFDQAGVYLRVGHHCAQPLMATLGVTGTARISMGLYNDENDLDRLAEALKKVEKLCF